MANPRPGVAPEDCGLAAALAGVVAYRDQHLPGKEIWLTEFGYDTDPGSRLRAPALPGADAQTVQGQWLARSFLVLLETGIDRAFLFVSRDSCTGTAQQCPNNAVQFSTSGVLTQKGDEQPKTAWYFLSTLRTRLGPLRHAGTVPSGKTGVSIARFSEEAGRQGAYAVWLTSSSGATVSNFALPLAPTVTAATLVRLAARAPNGNAAPLPITSQQAILAVSETPSLVMVQGAP